MRLPDEVSELDLAETKSGPQGFDRILHFCID